MSLDKGQSTGGRPVPAIVALSILFSLSLLITVVGMLSAQAASSLPVLREDFRSPAKQSPPIRYSTKTISLTTGVSPQPQALAIDESLGLAYVADGKRGTVTVVAGTALIDVIPVGQAVVDIGVDAGAGVAYASAADPHALFNGYIAVIHDSQVITRMLAGGSPGPIAVDPLHNRAYVGVHTAIPYSDQVAILQRNLRLSPVSVPPGIVALDVDPGRERAYVISEAGPSLSIISRTENIAVVPLDDVGVPRDIAVESSSGLVYVVGQPEGDDAGTVVVISDTGQIARLPAGPDPRQVVADPRNGRIYVTNAGNNTVLIIAGTEIIGTVDVGSAPDAIAVDPTHDRVYVSNTGDGTTTVLSGQAVITTLPAGGGPLVVDSGRGVAYLAGDGLAVAESDALLGRLPIAAMPARLAVNPQTGLVYVCNQGANTLTILSDQEVLATLHLNSTPREAAADPLSGWVYVVQDTELTVIREATVEATLPIAALDIALDPVRRRAYVASAGITVISGTQVLDTVDIGQPPRRVAVNRATGLVYATAGGQEDGFVAIISGTQKIGTVTTGGAPGKLVVNPVRERVFVLHPDQGRLSVIEGIQRRFPNVFLPRPALDAAINPLMDDVYAATRGPLVVVRGSDGDVINLGLEATAVDVDVTREVAYATTRAGQVAVLDGTEVVEMLSAGHHPVDLAVDSEAGRVYVANFGSDSITVITPAKIEPRETFDAYLPLIEQ